MPAIPQRWIPYKACGKVIDGTRFICFKVPLKKSVQVRQREIKEIWDIPALLQTIPNLGAVIDLTNTARYYNPEELQAAGILYKKILMPGRVVPPESKVTEFMDTVDEFLGQDCEFLIGIHCTHGLNRTGYMVCRYMRDRLGVPAKDAIKKFEKARGYQIEREIYIADLLGLPLPEEDVGVAHTEIKPVSNGYDSKMRSPLAIEEDESQERDRYNRFNRSRFNGRTDNRDHERFNGRNNDRDSGYKKKEDKNRTQRDNNKTNARRRSDSGSSSSYDFRYDY